MEMTLSQRECATIIAALRAWQAEQDCVGQDAFNRNQSAEEEKAGGRLKVNELEFLLRRFKQQWYVTGRDPNTPTC